MTNPKHNWRSWKTGYLPYLEGVSPHFFPGFKLNRVFNLQKTLDLPLGARYLKELDDEIKYSCLGAVMAGFLNKDEESQLLPWNEPHCSLSKHIRWTLGAREVAQAERLELEGKLEEARNAIIKLLLKSKQVSLRTEDEELADEMGLLSTFTGANI